MYALHAFMSSVMSKTKKFPLVSGVAVSQRISGVHSIIRLFVFAFVLKFYANIVQISNYFTFLYLKNYLFGSE